jgi:hypothetical protein
VEERGGIRVTLGMIGSDLDADGGTVSVDGLVAKAIETGGSVTFPDLAPGFHRVSPDTYDTGAVEPTAPGVSHYEPAGPTPFRVEILNGT